MMHTIWITLLGLIAISHVQAENPKRVRTARDLSGYSIQPVPFEKVELTDHFWSHRLETNRTVTCPHNLSELKNQGSFTGFEILAGNASQEYRGWMWADTDVYKTLEGMAYCLKTHPNADQDEQLKGFIDTIIAAQAPDGYLAPHLQLAEPNYVHFSEETTRTSESYNFGHFIEMAVAHYEATGDRRCLESAIKAADLLERVQATGELEQIAGHSEIEIALIRLYRATKEPKYISLAGRYVRNARTVPSTYCDRKPFLERDEAWGHAVAAGYLYSGGVDVAVLQGDAELLASMKRIWENVVSKKLFLTGGVGLQRAEDFGANYDLPSARAYAETCASIAMVFWNHRMFLASGDAKYVDVLERTLYNGVLAGIGMSGNRFFYKNPLACPGQVPYERHSWSGCPCCPVNLVRFLPQVPGLVYATSDDDIFVNLFVAGTGNVELGGQTVTLTQETAYPWDGTVKITTTMETPAAFTLRIRIPGWAQGQPLASDLYRYLDADESPSITLNVNNEAVPLDIEKGYAQIRREWKSGDQIELVLPMIARRVVAHKSVEDCTGRIGLERGPLVYCVEGVDHGGRVYDLALPDDSVITAHDDPNLLGGITVLNAQAIERVDDVNGVPVGQETTLKAVPYYAWNHRGPCEMTVWIARELEKAAPPSHETIAMRAEVTASYCWKNDTLAGVNDGIGYPDFLNLETRRLSWWPHQGTEEWVQYDFDAPTEVKAVEVCWFDDTNFGQCRAPQSWRLLYRDGAEWKPVNATSSYKTEVGVYNRLTFIPVQTHALRLVVQLQPEFTAGVQEWRVE